MTIKSNIQVSQTFKCVKRINKCVKQTTLQLLFSLPHETPTFFHCGKYRMNGGDYRMIGDERKLVTTI